MYLRQDGDFNEQKLRALQANGELGSTYLHDSYAMTSADADLYVLAYAPCDLDMELVAMVGNKGRDLIGAKGGAPIEDTTLMSARLQALMELCGPVWLYARFVLIVARRLNAARGINADDRKLSAYSPPANEDLVHPRSNATALGVAQLMAWYKGEKQPVKIDGKLHAGSPIALKVRQSVTKVVQASAVTVKRRLAELSNVRDPELDWDSVDEHAPTDRQVAAYRQNAWNFHGWLNELAALPHTTLVQAYPGLSGIRMATPGGFTRTLNPTTVPHPDGHAGVLVTFGNDHTPWIKR